MAREPGVIVLPSGRRLVVGPCHEDAMVHPCVSLNNSSVCEKRFSIIDYTVEPLDELINAVRAIAALTENYDVIGVCCTGGCGRTGTATILYMILYEGLSAEDAVNTFFSARGCGPESRDQWMTIAYAALLAQKEGLIGERSLERLREVAHCIHGGGTGTQLCTLLEQHAEKLQQQTM